MTKADKLMHDAIVNIKGYGYKDVNPRPHYADGAPAHTISINHVCRSYDLNKGEFPICTLRPIAWKTAIKEIFAIFQNQSNKISEFERMGCEWWASWSLEDGTIGKAYPYNLESHRPNEMKKLVKKIPRRLVDEKYKELKPVPQFGYIASKDDTIYLNRYRVIGLDKEKSKNHRQKYYKIQFLSNGYISSIRKDTIGKSHGINPYDRTVVSTGYLGDYKSVKNFTKEELEILKDKWESMMYRGYSQIFKNAHDSYDNVFVHHDWHSFEQFLRDIRFIPQYHLAKEDGFKGWDLDKDYYGSNAYSKDTCVFLKHNENALYAETNGCYEIFDTNTRNKYYEINMTEFAQSIGKTQSHLNKALRNRMKYLNYHFTYLPNTEEYVYRYELSRNQLIDLLKDLKENPYGRRHIISFWHWANIDKKSLVECAYETIWNVRNTDGKEYLDMALIQRSGDMLTASGPGGINEVQYAALLMMIARHTGYLPGVFTHFVANEQIYDRHTKAAEEILLRFHYCESEYNIKENCQLILNPDKTNFYDMTIDDFTIENYVPMQPQLELELGI